MTTEYTFILNKQEWAQAIAEYLAKTNSNIKNDGEIKLTINYKTKEMIARISYD